MTTFEIIVLILLAAIVGLFISNYFVFKTLLQMKRWQESIWQELRSIRVNVADTAEYTHNHIAPNIECIYNAVGADGCNNFKKLSELTDIVDKMHRNLCVEIADKMVNKMYPVNEGEPLDAHFELDCKLKKDIENKLNGFAAAVLDAECCPQEILGLWTERICESAHKFIKQFKIDWDKLSKEQQDEFLKRLIMPNYDKPTQPIYTPCYAPDGTCVNPHGDCINCPKRGTGGTWSTSTSIKTKSEMFQERFNDNKED